jgi:hypothetical protein
MISHAILLTASFFLASPLVTAMAQSNNPTGNLGSNNSVTASPGTADSKPLSGMNTGGSSPSGAVNQSSAAMNSNTPGGTGTTVVPGSTSSQSGSAAGTAETKTGAGGGGQK